MPRTLDMPTTPNFVQSEFRLVRAIGQVQSPYTGDYQTQEYDAVYWQCEVSLPPMRRDVAVNWQAFLTQLKGPINYFKMSDPDAKTNTGTYSTSYLEANARINDTSETLSFSGSTITAGTSVFTNAVVGDFIVITGATNGANNGTFRIQTKTSATVVVVDRDLVTESNTGGCKVRQNIKGAEGLSLRASTNSATGTIKKGDYLQIQSATNTTSNPAQLVLVVEDATKTTDSGKDKYSVRIEPKLRQDLADNNYVVFSNPKGLFRLTTPDTSWSADAISNYGIGFSVVEVV